MHALGLVAISKGLVKAIASEEYSLSWRVKQALCACISWEWRGDAISPEPPIDRGAVKSLSESCWNTTGAGVPSAIQQGCHPASESCDKEG